MQENSVPTDSVTSSFQVPPWWFVLTPDVQLFTRTSPLTSANYPAQPAGQSLSLHLLLDPHQTRMSAPVSCFCCCSKKFPTAICFEQGRRSEGRVSPKVSEVYDFYLTETTARDGKKAFVIFVVILRHGREGLKTAQRPRRRNTESVFFFFLESPPSSRSGTSGYVLRLLPPPPPALLLSAALLLIHH